MTRRIHRRLQIERLEERQLLSTITSVTEFPTPTPSAGLGSIAKGPDGNLWFTERSANKIGMINPTTHAITEFPVPTPNAYLWDIAAGPDGNLWFTERFAYKIGMINPTTHAITEYNLYTVGKKGSINVENIPCGITAGPDGNIWFAGSGADGLGMINPTTKAISFYTVPSTWGNYPFWITAGPDGDLWFNEAAGSSLGKINPVTHAETRYIVPNGPMGYSATYKLTAGPDGNIWFTDYNNNAIDMINPTTGAISEFYTPETANVDVQGITAGPDGNIWFTEVENATIGSINPTTHVITEYPLPAPAQVGRGITTGPDGNLWFTDPTNSAIGLATLSSMAPKNQSVAPSASGPAPTGSSLNLGIVPGNPDPLLVPLVLEDGSFIDSLVKDKKRHE